MPKARIFPGLVDLADAGVDIRPTLLRALTDLYVLQPTHSVEEERQYCELAHRLIDAVDVSTRVAVAAKLSSYPAAPPEVLELLRRDAFEVRKALLAARPDEKNAASAVLSAGGRGERIDPADAEAAELSILFAAACAEERRLILLTLDVAAPQAHNVPQAEPSAAAALEVLVLQRRIDEFVKDLARLLTISEEHARWIVQDAGGEPIVAAAKALQMPSDAVQRVLLFLNPAISHSVSRVYELARLYDDISPTAACALITIWQDAHPRTDRRVDRPPVLRHARQAPTSLTARVPAHRDTWPSGRRDRGRTR